MATEHNALKYGTTLARAAARVFGLGDEEPGLSRLGETLQPIADLWRQPEWAFLRGEMLWAVNPSQNATAAEFSTVGVSNPTGSHLIVVVEGLWNFLNTQLDLNLAANIAFDATGNPVARDTRRPVTGGVTGVQTVSFAHDQVASLGTRIIRVVSDNRDTWIPVNVVLSPGFAFVVQGNAVNTAVQATIIGRERRAFPGELERT